LLLSTSPSAVATDAEPKEADDASLVQAYLAGDRAAFEVLVRHYYNLSMSVSLRSLQNRHDAEEAVQDSLLIAFQKLGTIRPGVPFKDWLIRIVRFRSWNLWVARQRRRLLEQTDALTGVVPGRAVVAPQRVAATALDNLEAEETRERIMSLVAELPENQRRAFTLYVLDGWDQERVGREVGLTAQSVRQTVWRIRQRLAGALGC
jgi:RNA polymerase sigma-70 factor (ECF subfamily)